MLKDEEEILKTRGREEEDGKVINEELGGREDTLNYNGGLDGRRFLRFEEMLELVLNGKGQRKAEIEKSND